MPPRIVAQLDAAVQSGDAAAVEAAAAACEGALEMVAKLGSPEALQALLNAFSYSERKLGLALYATAKSGKSSRAVRLLAAAGAPLEAKDVFDTQTALAVAAENGRTDAVRELLTAGASVTALRTSDRATPLHLAAHGGHLDIVQLLVAAGAPLDAINIRGNPPLNSAAGEAFFAADYARMDVVHALMDAGASEAAARAAPRVSQEAMIPLFNRYHVDVRVRWLLVARRLSPQLPAWAVIEVGRWL